MQSESVNEGKREQRTQLILFTVIWRHAYGKEPLKNQLLPHGLLFPIGSKFFFSMHHPTAFVTPVVEH